MRRREIMMIAVLMIMSGMIATLLAVGEFVRSRVELRPSSTSVNAPAQTDGTGLPPAKPVAIQRHSEINVRCGLALGSGAAQEARLCQRTQVVKLGSRREDDASAEK
jgi:hypothetical protein